MGRTAPCADELCVVCSASASGGHQRASFVSAHTRRTPRRDGWPHLCRARSAPILGCRGDSRGDKEMKFLLSDLHMGPIYQHKKGVEFFSICCNKHPFFFFNFVFSISFIDILGKENVQFGGVALTPCLPLYCGYIGFACCTGNSNSFFLVNPIDAEMFIPAAIMYILWCGDWPRCILLLKLIHLFSRIC